MKRDAYVYASSRIRMQEKKLLTDSVMERLLLSHSIQEAVQILQETRYADVFNRVDHPENFEEALRLELVKQANLLEDVAKDDTLTRLLFLKYDFHNIKIVIKEVLSEADYEHLRYPFGSLFLPQVREWISDSNKNPKESHIQQAIEKAREAYQRNQDAQELDFILDKAYFEELVGLSKEMRSDFFVDYARHYADFTNVLAYQRFRNQDQTKNTFDQIYIEGGFIAKEDFMNQYGKPSEDILSFLKEKSPSPLLVDAYADYVETGKLTDLELARDNFAYRLAFQGTRVLYGPEVLYGYLLRVETEIQNLRIILSGKRAEVDTEIIRERIRTHA